MWEFWIRWEHWVAALEVAVLEVAVLVVAVLVGLEVRLRLKHVHLQMHARTKGPVCALPHCSPHWHRGRLQ
jgi:hypothetical protein